MNAGYNKKETTMIKIEDKEPQHLFISNEEKERQITKALNDADNLKNQMEALNMKWHLAKQQAWENQNGVCAICFKENTYNNMTLNLEDDRLICETHTPDINE